jgi:peptidoglycan/LPS O-acetylase OafA/YrhL
VKAINPTVPQSPKVSQGRLVQLDFLRGVAILLVLMIHTPPNIVNYGWLEICKPITRFGWAGVDLFFVLSGFLVGGLLFAEIAARGTLDVKRFLIRRAFKIWPAYFVYIAFCFVKEVRHGGSATYALHVYWPNFVHVQNFWATPAIHTWSLAVEEHFYLALPPLLLLLLRFDKGVKGLRLIPWISAGLLVICLGLRMLNLPYPYVPATHKAPTQLRMDSLFLGVSLSYCYYFHAALWKRLASHRIRFLCAGLACISPMLFLPEKAPFVFTIGFTLAAIGFACILAACVPLRGQTETVSAFWSNPIVKIIAWTGVYSYSIYLWHIDLVRDPSAFWLERIWKGVPISLQWTVYMSMYLPASIASGYVMGRLIEMPMLRVRERLFKPAKKVASAIAVPAPASQ